MRLRNPLAPAWARALPPVLGAGVVVGLAVVLAEFFGGDKVGSPVGVAASGVIVGSVVVAVLLPGRLRRAQREEDAAQSLRGLYEQNWAEAVRASRRGPVPSDSATRSVALRIARTALADRTENLAWSRGVTGLALVVVVVVAVVLGGGWWLLAAVVALGLIGDEMGRIALRQRVRALEP